MSRFDLAQDGLAHLIALPGITVEARDELEAALSYCRKGIDFADALHLAACKASFALVTFDNRGYGTHCEERRAQSGRKYESFVILS